MASYGTGDSQKPSLTHRQVGPSQQARTSLDGLSKPRENLDLNALPRRLSGSSTGHSGHKYSTRDIIPDSYSNSGEIPTPFPVQNLDEYTLNRQATFEDVRRLEQDYAKEQDCRRPGESINEQKENNDTVSTLATKFYTISYLIFFAILGTLARLGLQTLTFYPGAPVVFSELWANFAGSFIMGFLAEDRILFKEEWGSPMYDHKLEKTRRTDQSQEDGPEICEAAIDLVAAKKAHAATKKTIPLYVGLATGFCGSFTSFSSFIRDTFLALSNDLPTPLNHPGYPPATSISSTVQRNDGYSVMAVLAVIIITVSASISGLHHGACLATAVEPYLPTLPYAFTRKYLDPLSALLAWGCWLGTILLAITPPDRHSAGSETWRGRAVFALVFAPLGCLARFYASLYLNGKIDSFPLGTFAVNISGTIVLGMAWNLQHVPLGGVVGCQVLQGIQDGFCGCLTTVSTWVSELNMLKRSHAYKYGIASIFMSLCSLVVIMGSMRWTRGFDNVLCTH